MTKEPEKPRALVTGIRGFTGRYLARALIELGFEVYGTTTAGKPKDLMVQPVDLRDKLQVADFVSLVKPSVVAHLAAISFVPHSNVQEIYDVNVNGTRNLLEALAGQKQQPTSVLIASSGSVYGNSEISLGDESTPLIPANDYGLSKLAVEELVQTFGHCLPTTVVRPFNYTGKGQSIDFFVPKVVAHTLEKKSYIELGNLKTSRDFLDVRTIVWAYAKLLKLPSSGETYNLSSGKLVGLEEILEKIQRIGNHRLEIRSVSKFSRQQDSRGIAGDASKLWSVIGKPKNISLDSTLEWMLGVESGRTEGASRNNILG